MIPVGVPQVVLHVTDDRVVPVAEINRAIRADVDRGRAEVRVAGRNEVFECFAFEAGALLADLHAVDALEADDVAVQKISLKLLGEVAAGEEAGPWTGA